MLYKADRVLTEAILEALGVHVRRDRITCRCISLSLLQLTVADCSG